MTDTTSFKAFGPSSETAEKATRHATTVRERFLGFEEYPAGFTSDQIAARIGIKFLVD